MLDEAGLLHVHWWHYELRQGETKTWHIRTCRCGMVQHYYRGPVAGDFWARISAGESDEMKREGVQRKCWVIRHHHVVVRGTRMHNG